MKGRRSRTPHRCRRHRIRIVSPEYFRLMKIPVRAGRSIRQARYRDESGSRPHQRTDRTTILRRDRTRSAGRFESPPRSRATPGTDRRRSSAWWETSSMAVSTRTRRQKSMCHTSSSRWTPSPSRCAASGDRIASIPALRHDVAGLDPLLPLAQHGEARDAGRRIARRTPFHHARAAGLCRHRGRAVRHRRLWRARVSGRPAEERNRSSVGHRRFAFRRRLVVRARRCSADSGWPGRRTGRRSCGRPMDLVALLFGVRPGDPATLAIVVCALAGAAACATYVPARRAAGVDPSDALRAE